MAKKHPNRPADKDVERLEQALAEETRTSGALLEKLDKLQKKIAEQQERLNALGLGREETMHALAEARAELGRVSADRDQLRRELTRVDGVQTETIVLPEDSDEEPAIHAILPSIEELMASYRSLEETPAQNPAEASGLLPDEDASSEVMLAPDLMFPKDSGQDGGDPASARNSSRRVLVYLDSEPPIKYPLYKQVITIGRSATADIHIDDDFLSRVHARVVCDEYGAIVEDANSKNGIKVNSKLIERHALRHGDVIVLGKLRFTFIDTGA